MIQNEKIQKNYEEELICLSNIAESLNINLENEFKSALYIKDFLKLDFLLEELQLKIKSAWSIKNFDYLNKFSKSPKREEIESVKTIAGTRIPYSYERCFLPDNFESNLKHNVDSFESRVLIYSSGMSAILSAILFLNNILGKQESILCYFFGGYFETVKLLSSFSSFKYVSSLEENIDVVDLIYIEPIKYDLSLEVIDLDKILGIINRRKSKKPLFILLDTTLHGNSFQIISFLRCLSKLEQIIVINLRSLLKLDQEGLEFAHAGFMEIFASNKVQSILEKFYEILKMNRWVYSLSPTPLTVSLLDFKDFSKNIDYCSRILANNKKFHNRIRKFNGQGLIKEIIFPSGKTNLFFPIESPFVFLTIKDPSMERLQWVVDFLINNSEGIIYNRQSFGFRNISVDYFVTNEKNPKYIIKIAVGKMIGVSYYSLISSIEALTKMESYSQLYESVNN